MKNYRKVIAGMLAVLVSAGTTGAFAYQKQAASASAETTAEAESEPKQDDTADRKPVSGHAEKDETVYVMANADGTVEKIR